jgi:hypothetical protein
VRYIACVAYEIERTEVFTVWWDSLTEDEQVSVAAIVAVLAEKGPLLGRPYVDTLRGSELPNLKELRIQRGGKPYRVLFAFDPRQVAILLLGGKKGTKGWYKGAIAHAERLYAEYIEELTKEGLI